MSNIKIQDIDKISRLAKIEVANEEKETLAKQLGSIIGWVEKLGEVNTDNVDILTNVHEMNLRMEKDEIADGDIAEDVLKNAPNSKYGYFTVPKVIE